MPITALALLRLPQDDLALPAQALEDGVIVTTELDFSAEPAELSIALAAELGAELLSRHEDRRGILFIPSVAAPRARSYEDVVAEVGEGGVWGPLVSEMSSGHVQQSDFGALLGGMLAQLPPSLLASAQAAAAGDQGALDAMGAQVQALMGGSPALQGLAEQLGGMFGQAPTAAPGEELAALEHMFDNFGQGEAQQSSLREMVLGMQDELMKDPSKLQELAGQLFGDKKK